MILRRIVKVTDPDGRIQTLAVLPAAWVKTFPKNWEAEILEIFMGSLLVRLVDKKSMRQGNRYKLVRHSGSAQLSVPRRWLRDRAACPGDVIEIWESPIYPDRLLLRFNPKVSNADVASSLQQPTLDEFRRQGEPPAIV